MISTIVSYCSLDRRFIGPLIRQSLVFSGEVILVCFDHLLNGEVENTEPIKQLTAIDPRVRVVIVPFVAGHPSRYYHNLARWIGTTHARFGWLLLLDGDEIPEGAAMKALLLRLSPFAFDAGSFDCYWYFREPIYQALPTEECGLLIRKTVASTDLIFSDKERWAFKVTPELVARSNLSGESGPIFHHYSWVRTEEEMRSKVSAWGHKDDRDWGSAIREEFSRPFSGRDFVHGYNYRRVDNKFNLEL